MKAICILIVMFLFSSIALLGSDPELKRLIKERENQSAILKQLADSAIQGRVAKMYLLNVQMQKVLLIDDSIIRHTASLISSEKALSDSLTIEEQRASKLALNNSQLIEKTKSDLKMIFIMKIAIAFLLLFLVVLLYLLLFRKKAPAFDVEKAKLEIDNLQKENNVLQSQISNMQAKEQKISDTIDRAVESRISVLQSQLDAANEKNRSILSKIEKLIKDLSSVN